MESGFIKLNKVNIMNVVDFSVLEGLTIKSIQGLEQESSQVTILTECGRKFSLHHHQDCCEYVRLVDFDAHASELEGQLVSLAEMSQPDEDEGGHVQYDESYTWTYYRLRTTGADLTMRWLGESNGYYSEEVDFVEIK